MGEIIVIIFVVILFVFMYLRMIAVKKNRFADRENLSLDALYYLYFKKSGVSKNIVVKILNIIAGQSEITIGKLRPDDRFDKELSPVKGWEFDDGLSLLSEETRNLFKNNNIHIDITEIKTVYDYIIQIGQILEREHIVKNRFFS